MTCKGKKRVCVFYMYIDERRAGDDPRVRTKHISEMGGRLLEYAVSRLYRIGTDELSRSKGEHGKPFFQRHPEIHFNISHSGDLVVCAVSDFEIGIDIQEKERLHIELIAKKIMSRDEHERFLVSHSPEEFFFGARIFLCISSYISITASRPACGPGYRWRSQSTRSARRILHHTSLPRRSGSHALIS